MSAPAISRVIHARSRLIHDPTGFTSSPLYGGTQLGMSKRIEIRMISLEPFHVTAEEYHGMRVETIEGGCQRVAVAAMVREYDTDVLTACFGSNSPVAWTYTTRRGQLGSARAKKLLIAPQDPAHPGLYIPRAIPRPDAAAKIMQALGEEWGLAIVWDALPDATGRLYQWGPIETFTL